MILLVILSMIFMALKISGTVDWSWWLVLLPVLLPMGLVAFVFLSIGAMLLLALFLDNKGR